MMNKLMISSFAAIAGAVFLSGCGEDKAVAERYLEALQSGDDITLKQLTKDDDRLDKPVITEVKREGNETIVSFKVEKQDGSVKKGTENSRLVLFKDKQTGEWLVDRERSMKESIKAEAASRKGE